METPSTMSEEEEKYKHELAKALQMLKMSEMISQELIWNFGIALMNYDQLSLQDRMDLGSCMIALKDALNVINDTPATLRDMSEFNSLEREKLDEIQNVVSPVAARLAAFCMVNRLTRMMEINKRLAEEIEQNPAYHTTDSEKDSHDLNNNDESVNAESHNDWKQLSLLDELSTETSATGDKPVDNTTSTSYSTNLQSGLDFDKSKKDSEDRFTVSNLDYNSPLTDYSADEYPATKMSGTRSGSTRFTEN